MARRRYSHIRSMPTAPFSGCLPLIDSFTHAKPREPLWRPSFLSHVSGPNVSSETDLPTGTLVQRGSKNGQRGPGIQNEEMRVVLENTDAHRIAEANPHDKVWDIGFNPSDLLADSPPSWCGLNPPRQVLERTCGVYRQNTSGDNQPDILTLRDSSTDHSRLTRSPVFASIRLPSIPLFTWPSSQRLQIQYPMTMALRYYWLVPGT